MDNNFKYYRSPLECIKSYLTTLTEIPKVSKISVLDRIPSALAEKVMLAVIGVNRSQGCTDTNVEVALKKGVSQEQIDALLAGDLNGIPDNELPAILYAQLWAYKNGDLTPDVRKKVVKAYGEKAAFHIDTLIKRANFSTLCNNTVFVVKDNWKQGKRDLKSSISYLLCLPISAGSRRNTCKVDPDGKT